jgi:hypothetical protein
MASHFSWEDRKNTKLNKTLTRNKHWFYNTTNLSNRRNVVCYAKFACARQLACEVGTRHADVGRSDPARKWKSFISTDGEVTFDYKLYKMVYCILVLPLIQTAKGHDDFLSRSDQNWVFQRVLCRGSKLNLNWFQIGNYDWRLLLLSTTRF